MNAQRPAAEGQVVFAQIEPTTRCNFTCGFCSGRSMDQSDLSIDDFQLLLDSFPELEHIELQGEGEPLLHKGFFEMARRARTRGIRLSMITNGSLLSADRVAALLDLGMEAINISIESPDAATFQAIRGGRFEKVTEGIARLLAERRARGLDRPLVGFAITVLKDTVEDLPRIAALYQALGMDGGATLQPLSRMENYKAVYDAATAARLLDPDDERRLWQLAGATPALKAMLALGGRSGHFYPEMSRRFTPEHGCPWVRGGLYVDRHGAMTTCCMVKDSARHGIGKLGITPVEAALARRREIDAALEAERPPAQCIGCGYYRNAQQRARVRQRMALLLQEQQAAAAPAVRPE